jgi:NAD(P)H-dependent FMN reductase
MSHKEKATAASGKVHVLAVIGSLGRNSVTRQVVLELGSQLTERGCSLDVLDFVKEPLPAFNPDTAFDAPGFAALQRRVDQADVLLLGTPDYHGSMSGVIKTFLDHFWREFAGKLFATVVASHEKGLTVTDQLRTVARQCYAWTLPYSVSFTEGEDVKDGKILNTALRHRLEMMARDVSVYGGLLARQRLADLVGDEPGFMARHREIWRCWAGFGDVGWSLSPASTPTELDNSKGWITLTKQEIVKWRNLLILKWKFLRIWRACAFPLKFNGVWTSC